MLLLPLLFALVLPPLTTSLALPPPPSLPHPSPPHKTPPLQIRSNPHDRFFPLVFTTSQVLIPVTIAASHLEDLYSRLQLNAMFHWHDLAPMSRFAFRYGTLEIGFFGAGAPIEWDFVAKFAAHMLLSTSAGYICTYRTTWANGARTKAVSIALLVRE